MIKDVLIVSRNVFPDKRGDVLHMLRADAPFLKQFGEIYFSFINPGFVKGWKKHLKQTQHFAVPMGEIKLVLYDDRQDSPTIGQIQEIEIGTQNYQLVRIPAQVWYAFKAVGHERAMVANCTDLPHDPQESIQMDISDKAIPYLWDTAK